VLTLACVVALTGFAGHSAGADARQDPVAMPAASDKGASADAPPVNKPIVLHVIEAEGTVLCRADSKTPWKKATPVTRDMELKEGVEIRVSYDSRCTLYFTPPGWKEGDPRHARVIIPGYTDFSVPTCALVYSKEAGGDVFTAIAQMQSGKADIKVERIGLKNDFNVVVPDGTLAVRGTGFMIGTGTGGTEVTGSPQNIGAAIELKYAAQSNPVQLVGDGGAARSSAETPEPATNSLIVSVGAPPVAGTVASAAEAFQSAVVGSSQAPVIQQAVATVAVVAQVAAEASSVSAGQDGSGAGNNVLALFADLNRTLERTQDAQGGSDGTLSRLAIAAQALLDAQAALETTQARRSEFELVRDESIAAALDVADLFLLLDSPLSDFEDGVNTALFRAAAAFDATSFESSEAVQQRLNQVDAAGAAVNSARLEIVGLRTDMAAGRDEALAALSDAVVARLRVIAAVQNAPAAAATAEQARAESAQFVALVRAAIVDIESILARRPLDGIAQSLLVALDRLEEAETRFAETVSLRDQAVSTVAAAAEEAELAVLDAVEAAAAEAVANVERALELEAEAEEVSARVQEGIARLDLAIGAMLSARTESELTLIDREAAETALVIAEDRAALAQIEIQRRGEFQQTAVFAAVDAAQALIDAKDFLQQAIVSAGLTSVELANTLNALSSPTPDMDAATQAAIAARSFADQTDVHAGDARSAADQADVAADDAEAVLEGLADARIAYLARLAELRVQLGRAQDAAASAAGHASAAQVSAETADTRAAAFIALLSDVGTDDGAAGASSPAAAAIAAAERAVSNAFQIADAAAGQAEQASSAASTVAALEGSILNSDGSPIDFAASGPTIDEARASAVQADTVASEAERLALVADAEAVTAQAAVAAASGGAVAASQFNAAQGLSSSIGLFVADAQEALDRASTASDEVASQTAIAESSANDSAAVRRQMEVNLTQFDVRLSHLLAAMEAQDPLLAEELLSSIAGSPSTDGLVADALHARQSAETAASAAQTAAAPIESDFNLATALDGLASGALINLGLARTAANDARSDAVDFAGFAAEFSLVAQQAGSQQQQVLQSLVSVAQAAAASAATSVVGIDTLQTTAAALRSGLQARLGSFVPQSADVASAAAQQAGANYEFVVGQSSTVAASTQTALRAVDALRFSLQTFALEESSQVAGVGFDLFAGAFNTAMDTRDGLVSEAVIQTGLLASGLATAQSAAESADNRFVALESAFDEMLTLLQGGEQEGTVSSGGLPGGGSSGDPLDVLAALERAQQVQALALGIQGDAAQSLAGVEGGREALAAAEANLLGAQVQANIAQARADASLEFQVVIAAAAAAANSSAGQASTAALQAQAFGETGIDMARDLGQRAFNLSQEALTRAIIAMDRRAQADAVAASMQVSLGASAEGISNAASALATAAGGVGQGENASAAAQQLALVGPQYGALAENTVGAVFAAVQASDAFSDAALAASQAQGFAVEAQAAVGDHALALSRFDGPDGLDALSSGALSTAVTQSEEAVQQATIANLRFIDAQTAFNGGFPAEVSLNAGLSGLAASLSTTAANVSNTAAIQVQGHADQAVVQAGISAAAGERYTVQVNGAQQSAAAATAAWTACTAAASRSDTFSIAAQDLALQIGSVRAGNADTIARGARSLAIVQLSQATAARDAAQTAADAAATMGERVFFTATAALAAQVVARAEQARAAADTALASAVQAQADAAAAAQLAAQSGGGAVSPGGGAGGQ